MLLANVSDSILTQANNMETRLCWNIQTRSKLNSHSEVYSFNPINNDSRLREAFWGDIR